MRRLTFRVPHSSLWLISITFCYLNFNFFSSFLSCLSLALFRLNSARGKIWGEEKFVPLCLMNYSTTTFHNAFVVTAVCSFTIPSFSHSLFSRCCHHPLQKRFANAKPHHVSLFHEEQIVMATTKRQTTKLNFQKKKCYEERNKS